MNNKITKQILGIIRNYVYQNEISMSEFARRAGISKSWLSKLKHTDANLSIDTAFNLLNEAGYTMKIEKK